MYGYTCMYGYLTHQHNTWYVAESMLEGIITKLYNGYLTNISRTRQVTVYGNFAPRLRNLDSKIHLTHDSSLIGDVRSGTQITSNNASEFCSLSMIDSAWSSIKVAEISL